MAPKSNIDKLDKKTKEEIIELLQDSTVRYIDIDILILLILSIRNWEKKQYQNLVYQDIKKDLIIYWIRKKK